MSLKRRRLSDDEDPYFKSYADIGIHEQMISDEVRTQAYRSAILHGYKYIYGKVVLDVGAGTGILSMFCVHAGAKKVYAIEASAMAEQAELIVQSNAMQDRITVIHGRIEDIELPEQVDVIVSEWMGYMMVYESMLTSVITARDKWLKPGGVMFPDTAKLYMAPISDCQCYDERLLFWDTVKDKYKVDMSALKPFAMKCLVDRIHVQPVNGEDVMAQPAEICSYSLSSVTLSELLRIRSSFTFDCFGNTTINGFVLWFKVNFSDGTCLSTSPYDSPTHWEQSVMYVSRPFAIRQADVIAGSITIVPSPSYQRFLNVTVDYRHNEDELQQLQCIMDDFAS